MQVLLYTGPWVALIDKSETMHKKCFKWLQDFSGELYTTEAVLAEVMYFLDADERRPVHRRLKEKTLRQ